MQGFLSHPGSLCLENISRSRSRQVPFWYRSGSVNGSFCSSYSQLLVTQLAKLYSRGWYSICVPPPSMLNQNHNKCGIILWYKLSRIDSVLSSHL